MEVCPNPVLLPQVLVQPEVSGLQELDLGSNNLTAGSVHKIINLLTVSEAEEINTPFLNGA